MNIANLITLFRVVVLLFIVYFIYQDTFGYSLLAFLFLVLALLSDFLDGFIARWRKEVTQFGSFLDPFIDKLFIVVLLFIFVLNGLFWWLPFLFFILRDLCSVLIRRVAAHDDLVLREGFFHKLTTYSQYAIIVCLLLIDLFSDEGLQYLELIYVLDGLIILLVILALMAASMSVVRYLSIYLKHLKTVKKNTNKIKTKDLVILANKRARGYKDRYRRSLLKRFAKRRDASLIFLPNEQDMYKNISSLVRNKEHIIIAGGDGTFESALNFKRLKNKSLGFFPLGAGNAFYAYFYRGKKFEYLRSRFKFREEDIDVLELEWEKGKRESLFLSVGIDAEVTRFSSERTHRGFFDYVKASWKAAYKARAEYDINCIINGRKHHFENLVNLTLAKVPYYGYNLRSLVGYVNPSDGKVYGLALINTHSSFINKTLRLWALVLTELGIDKSPLFSLKGKTVELYSEVPFPIQAGGEFLGYSQWLKVKVIRKQRVLMI